MNNKMDEMIMAGDLLFTWGLLPILIAAVVVFQIVSLLRVRAYRHVVSDFMAGRTAGLEERAEKVRKKLGPNRQGKMKKKNAEAYNNLCHILASMAMMRQDEATFLDRISEMEYEDEYALRPFTLALYYLSQKQPSVAAEHYYDFKACKQKDWSMGIVMDHLFDPTVQLGEEDLPDALDQFRNPATVYLLEQVGLLGGEDEEEDEEYEEYEEECAYEE